MKEKIDQYAAITNSFIESLELVISGQLAVPGWVKPWKSIGAPRNAFSGRNYQGMNSILLGFMCANRGWSDVRFATYNQISANGGQVKKGETGTRVVMWKFIKDKNDPSNTIPLLRFFTVFNVNAQTDLTLPVVVPPNNEERKAHCEEVFGNTGAVIEHGSEGASYNFHADVINMPDFESFKNADGYYATLAHELIHWTGHDSRLKRPLNEGRFGNEAYAFEELVAELGASFICQDLGIDGSFQENHLAYLKSWLKVLKNDTRAVFRASSLASAAAKSILPAAETHEDEAAETEEAAA